MLTVTTEKLITEVVLWMEIVFLHPRKYHVKMNEDLFAELKEFCASVYN